jgi:transketolase
MSTGLMTEHAIDAAVALEGEGIEAGVLHVATLKPFEEAGVAAFAAEHSAIVTAENHVVRGGLATQVAERLYRAGLERPLGSVGIADAFVELGATATLMRRRNMSAAASPQRRAA